MIIIKKGDLIGGIETDAMHRIYGGTWNYVNKIYINKYDSIDISSDNSIAIMVNENIWYRITIKIPSFSSSNYSAGGSFYTYLEKYIESLLKQSIREDKLEEILK